MADQDKNNSILVGIPKDALSQDPGRRSTKRFAGRLKSDGKYRNRHTMLEKVSNFWMKGVLEQSLYGMTLIPRRTKMIDIFEQAGGKLLIVRLPGSGKTTLLLELTRDLNASAEQDEALPIPVVFNLSSWGEKPLALAKWLVEELCVRYEVSRKVGTTWVENDNLLLLFDGLDELEAEDRAACVEAINLYC